MNRLEITRQITDFLTQIGLKVSYANLDDPTLLPGILIDRGEIIIDIDKLTYPGDLLHEAGHVAVMEPQNRELILVETMGDAGGDRGEEVVTILWSYAAIKAIGLPVEVLFHPDGYKGDSPWLTQNFESGNYIGLPLLEWMGMTAGPEKAKKLGIEPFPNMIQWLHP